MVTSNALLVIVKQMLDPPDDTSALHSEGLRVELLQMARGLCPPPPFFLASTPALRPF